MTILSWILLGVCVMLVCFLVLMCHALTISLEERDRWYTPLEPVTFDYLDAEVDDAND